MIALSSITIIVIVIFKNIIIKQYHQLRLLLLNMLYCFSSGFLNVQIKVRENLSTVLVRI
jgi:hypothetical protein